MRFAVAYTAASCDAGNTVITIGSCNALRGHIQSTPHARESQLCHLTSCSPTDPNPSYTWPYTSPGSHPTSSRSTITINDWTTGISHRRITTGPRLEVVSRQQWSCYRLVNAFDFVASVSWRNDEVLIAVVSILRPRGIRRRFYTR